MFKDVATGKDNAPPETRAITHDPDEPLRPVAEPAKEKVARNK